MRYFLSMLTLTLTGCGSTSWFGLQRWQSPACDGEICQESSLSPTESLRLDPAPFTEYPLMEETVRPLTVPDFESVPTEELVPVPDPDPAT